MMSDTLPYNHNEFLSWAISNGITFSKIRPMVIPDAGLGIISTSPITGPERSKQSGAENRLGFSVGEEITHCPTSALLNRESATTFAPSLPDKDIVAHLSTHALLAAAIALEKNNYNNKWRPWIKVLPTLDEFQTTMPLLWSDTEKSLLPPSADLLLKSQEKKFCKDWDDVSNLNLNINKVDYQWAWLVVNTRTLFYKTETSDYEERSRDDCMAMCPFVDYFNHSDEGCKVEFSKSGYTVITNSVHPANVQLFVSYGCHSNDFLLGEYGFILHENKWDEVLIDTLILPVLSEAQRDYLDTEGFLGNYILDKSTFCYRTQAAVRILLIPIGTSSEAEMVERWRSFLHGQDEGEREQSLVDEYFVKILDKLRKLETEAQRKIEQLDDGHIKRILKHRWHQILEMVNSVDKELNKKPEGVSIRKYMLGTY